MSGFTQFLQGDLKRYTGRDLRRTREVVGLPADEFAATLGVSRSMLYRLEANKEGELSFPLRCAVGHLRRRYLDMRKF